MFYVVSLFSCELLNYLTLNYFIDRYLAIIISNDNVNVGRDMQLLWRNMEE